MPTSPPPIASPEQLERIGQAAAQMVKNGDRVGLGSGRAAQAFVRVLGERVRAEKLDIIGVPTSRLTEQLAHEADVPLGSLDTISILDIAIDGADEVDGNLNLMKGGGGNLLREKVVASIARRFVVVVGGEKVVSRLGERFPVFVEVVAFALPVVTRALIRMNATVSPRKNADGGIFTTDNGNPLLHCQFADGGPLSDPAALDAQLHQLPGVIETGLFIGMAQDVLIGHADGRLEHRTRGEHRKV